MTLYRFTGGHVATGAGVLADAEIEVRDGRIAAIGPLHDAQGTIDLDGGWVLPGFVDTQVNGGGGVLFNDDTSVDAIAAIGAAHARYGTTTFLPTLISDTPDRIAAALDAVDAAIEAGVPGVVGAHIEGPVLNPLRKGIHDAALFRPLDDTLLAILTRPRRGRVMVTLAPEKAGLPGIRALVEAGVIVSAGHSEADYDTMLAALDAGMTGVTHLFNAMPPLIQRAPGVVGAALDDTRPWCGLIVDDVHVARPVLRAAMRCRPFDRMMLVTDAMPSVGAGGADFMLQGRRIHVADGRCSHADGTLAGSDLDMASALRNSVATFGITPDRAAMLAATHPAAFLGLAEERGRLAPGLRADWVQLDADLHLVETHVARAVDPA
ncbi:N-acetylglucosamine-6-phosphate deacetylase [Sphingomonas sp. KR1UV-12]|uniref:N-acetylglucosamine-6-phosphate deacetylase n=1 Tax=Sphingomonas aurea TaxID=3063994 RepID=A0ABT9ELH6_9SPHN|nr:N-acetylglucosamine-6-phosphate deacetylase [Sphingomonas sp. KR1UV-12]MDP1027643.1 N-acetylglucosamine-6-phosphate deacetylase [Sphingomonas sp. KR1UV-12]